MKLFRIVYLTGMLAVLGWAGCSSDVLVGADFTTQALGGAPGSAGQAASGGSGEAGAGGVGPAGAGPCETSTCSGRVYRCGNCMDDDGDGAVDEEDPECAGPCDDTEDNFSLGIPGANNAPCRQDCFFDQDSGPGNDGCIISQRCDPLALAPDYPPSGDPMCAFDMQAMIPSTNASCEELSVTQAPQCAEACGPLVPNGCDCFGCCELPAGSGTFVWLGSNQDGVDSCNEETLGDSTACRPCTQVSACVNRCDPCEVCMGRSTPDPSCDATGSPRCASGRAACGEPGLPRCAAGEYCITGCCEPEPR